MENEAYVENGNNPALNMGNLRPGELEQQPHQPNQLDDPAFLRKKHAEGLRKHAFQVCCRSYADPMVSKIDPFKIKVSGIINQFLEQYL